MEGAAETESASEPRSKRRARVEKRWTAIWKARGGGSTADPGQLTVRFYVYPVHWMNTGGIWPRKSTGSSVNLRLGESIWEKKSPGRCPLLSRDFSVSVGRDGRVRGSENHRQRRHLSSGWAVPSNRPQSPLRPGVSERANRRLLCQLPDDRLGFRKTAPLHHDREHRRETKTRPADQGRYFSRLFFPPALAKDIPRLSPPPNNFSLVNSYAGHLRRVP